MAAHKKKMNNKLMKSIKEAHKAKSPVPSKKKAKKDKVEKVMHEYKEGSLHSGSKKGPQVKSKKQAVAIALSEARKAGQKVKAKHKAKKK